MDARIQEWIQRRARVLTRRTITFPQTLFSEFIPLVAEMRIQKVPFTNVTMIWCCDRPYDIVGRSNQAML